MTRKLQHFEDTLTWEEKAKENPLYAIMSHKEFEGAQSEPAPEQLAGFYGKGVHLWNAHFKSAFETISHAPPLKVLEYGCGMGRILQMPAQTGAQCYGIDISPTQLELARKHMPHSGNTDFLALENGRIIPLPDNSIDYAYSFAVLQHIQNTDDLFFAISEIIRVTKPGGTINVQVPYRDSIFDGRYRVLKRFNLGQRSFWVYLHKKYFYLPVVRTIAHSHWGGAAYYVSLSRFLQAFSGKTLLTSVEHTNLGSTFIKAVKK